MRHGLTISHAAERAGVGVETIRFYERRGLIEQPPRPRSGGVRFYDDSIIDRIRFIRQAQELGFSLREIKELLALQADPAADCSDVRKQAIGKRAEVERKITQLQHMRAALDELIASCPGGGALRACTIMDALAEPSGAGSGRAIPPDATLPSLAKVQQRRSKGHTMRTAVFKVDGMHCDGCARTIEALVATEPGVRKATVSYKGREARILFEPSVANEDRLADVIRRAGYSVADRS